MQFLLLMYQNEKAMRSLSKDEMKETHGAYMAYVEAMSKAGVLKANHGLKATADAKTVRASSGKPAVLDGPYADTKEQLAGYFLVDVKNMDEAVSWAEKNPTVRHGSVEVRPVWG
jgi:hypothetical protein